MQNNPYGNPPPYGPPPGGGFGAPGGPPGGPPGGNPYGPPGAYGPPPGGGGGAIEKVNLPAIFMMIAMGIGMAFGVLSLIMNLLGTGMGAMAGGDEGMANMMSGVMGIVFNLLGLATGGFVIFAMTKARKGEGWGMSVGGTIVGMLPCIGPCCWFGLPIGIWMLMNEEVKRSFKS
ncbi:MAG: hypothetical protein R3B89_11810 [Polyangiaceae bacterium]